MTTSPVEHPVHELVSKRSSPYAFAETAVSDEDLRSLFEAARWAPSAFNEQPWRFIVARRSDGELYERVLGCLVPGNQSWAGKVPVLVITVTRTAFARNEKPNLHAWHDVGLAAANLTMEATARGLVVHQMAGIDPDAARKEFQIPEPFEAVTAVAIGHPGDPNALPDGLKERDLAPRTRHALADSVFGAEFGTAAGWLD